MLIVENVIFLVLRDARSAEGNEISGNEHALPTYNIHTNMCRIHENKNKIEKNRFPHREQGFLGS